MTLYDQVQSMRTIDRLLAENSGVAQTATSLREPMRTAIRAVIGQDQQGAQQQQAPAQRGIASGAVEQQNFSQLTNQFKQISAAVVPLSQELLIVEQSRSNLEEWHRSIASESKHDLIALLFRVFGIAAALAIVRGLSELWRRLTFRYVRDERVAQALLDIGTPTDASVAAKATVAALPKIRGAVRG